jgi:hypothetical protein
MFFKRFFKSSYEIVFHRISLLFSFRRRETSSLHVHSLLIINVLHQISREDDGIGFGGENSFVFQERNFAPPVKLTGIMPSLW